MAGIREGFEFGEFRLDSRARELYRNGERVTLAVVAFDCLAYLIRHRDRPVGRDELISAVWGRADVSESTLAHTVVRLRQALGDNGNDQHSIRTVPRFGYRWVAPVGILETASKQVLEPKPTEAGPDEFESAERESNQSESIETKSPNKSANTESAGTNSAETKSKHPDADSPLPCARSRARWRAPAMAAGMAAAVLLTALIAIKPWRSGEPAPAAAPAAAFAIQAALVTPAEVDAPQQWAWLRLGLMDLVANRLRESRLPTVPSETALSLGSKPMAATSAAQDLPTGISLRVLPEVSLVGEKWQVTLHALGADGRRSQVNADGPNAMSAARAAADKLLVAYGYTPPPEDGQTHGELEAFLQQVAAERLADRLPRAAELLENAPAKWKALPEVQLTAARVDCDRGAPASCERRLATLKSRITAQEQPVVWGGLLFSQAWLHVNRAEFSKATMLLDEIIDSDREWNGSDVLGNAYSLRGWLGYADWRLDEAAADLGRARAIFLGSGNLRELARVEQRMGVVAERKGQLTLALASLKAADQQFSNLGSRSDQTTTLMALAQVQEQLLQFEGALATTDRFWSEDTALDWSPALFRAWALAGNGRLKEAEALIAPASAKTSALEHSYAQTEAAAFSAHVALLRGDHAQAIHSARLAKSPLLEESDRRDYLSNWRVLIQALRGSGQLAQARVETDALQKWAAGSQDDRLLAKAQLTLAEQAWVEGSRDQATRAYEQAMAYTERQDVPEITVAVASSYATALIESGQLEKAGAVSGRLGAWMNQDMRAAWVQALLLHKLGNAPAAEAALRTAKRLAGERQLKPIPGMAQDG